MGMDYLYAGSASYERFDNELSKIAIELFDAKLNDKFLKRKEAQDKLIKNSQSISSGRTYIFPFGFLYSEKGDEKEEKIIFPKYTRKVIKKFFNNPYDEFTVEETKQIADIILSKNRINKVREISPQLFKELTFRRKYKEQWFIF